jgi:hypothetical protein
LKEEILIATQSTKAAKLFLVAFVNIEIAEKVRIGGRAPPRLRRCEAGVAPKGHIETTASLKKSLFIYPLVVSPALAGWARDMQKPLLDHLFQRSQIMLLVWWIS